MTCNRIANIILCGGPDYQRYICYESATYLFEFSHRHGPAWFTVPGDELIEVEPDGHMSFLWDFFENMEIEF